MSNTFEVVGDFLGGGGDAADRVTYSQSPEQAAVYNAIMPSLMRLTQAGETGAPAWNTPAAPTTQGYNVPRLTTPQTYNVPNYQVPSNVNLLPTANWYSNLSPEVMRGLNAPYDEARSQMLENMGATGQVGSAAGGYTGAAGAALGEFEANRANQIGLQAWQMTQPGLQADYSARLARNQWLAGAQLGANQWSANAAANTNLANWQANLSANQWAANANQQAALLNWQNQAEAYKFPSTALPGLLGGTYSSPIVDTSPSAAGNIGAGLLGGLGGYGFGQQIGANPWVTGGIGALGTMMGGK